MREITPGQFLITACDEKITDEDLTDEGNAFAEHYFQSDASGGYMDDYAAALGRETDSLYHVADTWANFDLLAPVIQKRFDQWKTRTQ